MAKSKDFFISYTRSDRAWAEWIAWTLEEAGFSTVIQAWDFRPGANFVLEMDAAARTSRQTVIVLSPAYIRSGFARSEWAAGFSRDPNGARRRLLPVRVAESRLPPLLKALVYADLVGASEADARQRLLDALRPRLKPQRAPAFPGAPPAAPGASAKPAYPGGAQDAAHLPPPASPADCSAAPVAATLFRSVAERSVAPAGDGHYQEVARLLATGKLVPFLGLGVHFEVGDNAWGAPWSPSSDFFPSTREYGVYLAQDLGERERVETGTELARVYQFLDETKGRVFVQSTVHRLYNREYPSKAAHAFLASANSVLQASGRSSSIPLIVTTNLDDVLESAFKGVGEPFCTVSYISAGVDTGRLLFRSSRNEAHVLKTIAQTRRAALTEGTMILKLHGGVDRRDPERESMLLTEDEIVAYFGSPAVLELIPALFDARVGSARFLFLGYSLRDWNIRFLLARMWGRRRQDLSWAVLHNTSEVTRTLWGKRGVEIMDVPVEQYLAGLAREMASMAPDADPRMFPAVVAPPVRCGQPATDLRGHG